MPTDLFRVIAELHILLDQQLLTASSSFTRHAGVAFMERSQRIYSLSQYLNTQSVEKLTAIRCASETVSGCGPDILTRRIGPLRVA